MFVQDYILNGRGFGQLAETLASCRFDPGILRPYEDERGRKCVTINTGRSRYDEKLKRHVPIYRKELIANLMSQGINPPVFNALTLRKEEWIQLDTVVVRAARYRLRAWTDLAAANSFGGFNGMSKMILEHETQSDPGEAIVDMDGITEGRTDAPKYQLNGLPLPITHSDFWYSQRRLAASRNTNTPLDTTMGEAAGRRVAEMIEKTTIGNVTGVTYGGEGPYSGGLLYPRNAQVFGYVNFPSRITNTSFYRPTGNGRSGTGWVPADTLKDVLAARDTLYANKFYGPFMIYHSSDWDQYMDNDYILSGGNVATQTLRERLKSIEGIMDVRRLDFLFASVPNTSTGPGGENVTGGFPFRMVFVQMTPDVARAVNGMDITTVQWESQGGMRLNFKVMCIQVPHLRSDFYGNCGILDATATQ